MSNRKQGYMMVRVAAEIARHALNSVSNHITSKDERLFHSMLNVASAIESLVEDCNQAINGGGIPPLPLNVKRYRCIIFAALYPRFLLDENKVRRESTVSEDLESPEKAMLQAARSITNDCDTASLSPMVTWQPSSGKVYVNGTECGVVFTLEK